MSAAVKHTIQTFGFEEIHEGDYFLQNDPYIGCLHAMDMQIIHPLFWEGKLVAWSAAASHQSDTGGIDPGGFCIRATDRYQEGFRVLASNSLKKGIDGKISSSYFAIPFELPTYQCWTSMPRYPPAMLWRRGCWK